MYKVELKSVKLNLAFSNETICFKSSLYINGKNVGTCNDDGNGGCINIYTNSSESNELVKKTNEWLKSQPKVKIDIYEIENNLELVIGELINKEVEALELKKLKTKMKTNLVYQKTNGDYCMVSWKHEISLMLSSEIGFKLIKEKINKLKLEGCVILNDNIPSTLK